MKDIREKKTQPKQAPLSKGKKLKITRKYQSNSDVILFKGDRLDLMRTLPEKSVQKAFLILMQELGMRFTERS
jgi:hypothetical protein